MRLAALVALISINLPAQVAPWRHELAVAREEVDIASARPSLQLGENEGLALTRVHAILPRADGAVIVVDRGANSLLMVKDGSVTTLGREGSGPGEYRDLVAAVILPADTIAVLDGILRRVTLLAPSGAYVRDFRVAAPFEGGGAVMRMVALGNGDLMIGFSEVTVMAPSPMPVAFMERLFVFSTAGTLRRSAGLSKLSSERFVQRLPRNQGGIAYWRLAFGRALWVRPVGAEVAVGDGSAWSVEIRHMPDGTLLGVYHLDRPVQRVSEADKEAFRQAELRNTVPSSLLMTQRMLEEMPYPAFKPAFSRLETDRRHRLWLEDYSQQSSANRLWLCIDPAERFVKQVRMPTRFRPMAFTAEGVYGIWKDPDHVEHLQFYRLKLS